MSRSETPLEPWVGYELMTTSQRHESLRKRVDAARDMGDQWHAVALTAAVVNYELLRDGSSSSDKFIKDFATDQHFDARSWIGT